AVPDGRGGWAVGEALSDARRAAGKVQGRRTTAALRHPLRVPDGDWDVTLRTTWVEPAYLELDASWCAPGGEPATPLANGGAFGGKVESVAPAVARRLADEHGRPVRVLLSREDAVRTGPKRPPLAAGARADGSGVVRRAGGRRGGRRPRPDHPFVRRPTRTRHAAGRSRDRGIGRAAREWLGRRLRGGGGRHLAARGHAPRLAHAPSLGCRHGRAR